MDDSRWETYGAGAGIGAVALMVSVMAVAGTPPNPTDSAAKIGDYFRDNQDGIRYGMFIFGLAILLLLWWGGSVWQAIKRAEGGDTRLAVVAIAGLVLSGAAIAVANSFFSGVAIRIGEIPDGDARVYYMLVMSITAMSSFGNAAFVGATSAVAIRTKFLPAWLAWGGGVLAFAWMIAGSGVATDGDEAFICGFVAFGAWLVWIIAVSVVMIRARTREGAASSAA